MRLAPGLVDLAGAVITRADREQPADSVLRTMLRETRGLGRAEGRAVSRAVFSYYRWRGWLDASADLRQQIEAAREMADRFRREPRRFPPEELRRHAAPSWVDGVMDVTDGWLQALQTEPPLWIRARPGQGQLLSKRLAECRPAGSGSWADALCYSGSVDLHRTREFREGWFEIQDLHSQAVGFLCAPQSGETWWDACAGEGGKTLHLADLMANRGLIWATDRAAWRLDQLKRRAARAAVFNYRTRVWDGGAALPTRTQFDGVLVDAPCSNLGTWHRNPHARWTTCETDVDELAEVQQRILRHVVPAVKPGGRLIYAVCTLTRPETTETVEVFSRAFPELEPIPLTLALPSAVRAGAGLSLVPGPGSGNGMFVAAWRRRPPTPTLAKGDGSPL